jgi:pimeloyl-ACP methyl ester carboxylesterase
MQVIVDGLLTTYEVSGKGQTVVLLHGWGDRAAGLADLQAQLAKHFAVLAPDLPGFGSTQTPQAVWVLENYAQFVANFLEKVAVKNVYAFIGHSNGGAIAICGLGRGVLGADKLVLLATAGIRDSYQGRRKALRLLTKTGKALTAPLPVAAKQKLRRKVYDTIGSDMLVAEHLQETFKKIVTDDVQADAAKIVIPTLLIYGENDRATPVWYGEKFHELIDDSTLEILPAAGHFVHRDRPHEVIKAITEFLQ